jgi:hypothetical protein
MQKTISVTSPAKVGSVGCEDEYDFSLYMLGTAYGIGPASEDVLEALHDVVEEVTGTRPKKKETRIGFY